MAHDPSNITPGLIDVAGFIKHSRIKLTVEEDILTFYKNLQSQGLQYNIFLLGINSITPDSDIFHPDLMTATTQVTDTALGMKLLEDDLVSKDYGDAKSVLLTTTSGSKFLFQLFKIKRPNLSLISLATIYTPRYSTTKCLYWYENSIANYVEVQPIIIELAA